MLPTAVLAAITAAMTGAAVTDLRTQEVPDGYAIFITVVGLGFHLATSLTGRVGVDWMLVTATAALALAWVAVFRLLPAGPRAALEQRVSGVPAWFPLAALLFTAAALLYGEVLAVQGGAPVIAAAAVGTLFFTVGWGMYLAGMWGGADALMLAATGYALPVPIDGLVAAAPWPFPVSVFTTVLLTGAAFSVVYAVVIAVVRPELRAAVAAALRSDVAGVGAVSLGYAVTAGAVGRLTGRPQRIAVPAAVAYLAGLAVYMLLRVVRTVEENGMRRTVPADAVTAGDIPAEDLGLAAEGKVTPGPVEQALHRVAAAVAARLGVDYVREPKIVGLTPEQAAEVRDRYDTVTVKTGVPFLAAFPLAVAVLLVAGDPVVVLVPLPAA